MSWVARGNASSTDTMEICTQESVIVGYAATPEALEEQQKKKEDEMD